jgi:YD repeat-containing protein
MPRPESSKNETDLQESRRTFLARVAVAGIAIVGIPAASKAGPPTQDGGVAMPDTYILPPQAGTPRSWSSSASIYSGVVNGSNGNVHLFHPICAWSDKGPGVEFIQGPVGKKWKHTYETRVVSVSNTATVEYANGTKNIYTFNGTSYVAPTSIYVTLTYNPDGTWKLTDLDAKTIHKFSSTGQLLSISDPNNNTTTLNYTNGVLTSVTDSSGRNLVIAYSSGRVSSVTDFEGRVRTLQYNFQGNVIKVIDPPVNGIISQVLFSYVGNNVSSITDKLNKAFSYQYNIDTFVKMIDPSGVEYGVTPTPPSASPVPWPTDVVQVSVIGDTSGSSKEVGFDINGRAVALRGGADQRVINVFDSNNRLVSSANNSGLSQSWTYNSLGKVTSHTDPQGNTIQINYDASGNVISRVDQNGNTATAQYNVNNNLTQMTNPLGSSISYGINPQGLVTSIVDERGKTTTFTYNSQGNIVSSSDPNGNTTQISYIGNSNRINQYIDSRGRVTAYQYDALGRQIGVSYPTSGNTGITSVLDKEGRLIQTTDATGTRSYTLDNWGRRIALADPMGTTYATYANDGALLSQTDPSGRTHTNTYDIFKRLTSVSDGTITISYTYDQDGSIVQIDNSTGVRTSFAYDSIGRSTGMSYKRLGNNSLIASYNCTYDSAGRVAQVTELPSGDVTSYQYDLLGRLLTESRTGFRAYQSAYTYDAAGNRLSGFRSENGVVSHNASYTYDNSSQILSVNDTATGQVSSFNWYPDGTLQSFSGPGYTRVLEYSEENQLTKIRRDYGGGNVVDAFEYAYAADGARRSRKDFQNGVWNWYPCGVSCCAGEMVEMQKPLTGGSWTPSALYTRGPAALNKTTSTTNRTVLMGLGTRYLEVDNQGNIVEDRVTDAFGVVRQAGNSAFYTQSLDESLVITHQSIVIPQLGVQILQKPQQNGKPQKPPKPIQRTKEWCSAHYNTCNAKVRIDYDTCIAAAVAAGTALAGICATACAKAKEGRALVLCLAACGLFDAAMIAVIIIGCRNSARDGYDMCLRWYEKCLKEAVAAENTATIKSG